MKACLICPAQRRTVTALARNVPLSNFPVLGKSLLEYWLEHLAGLGASHVRILAADRPEMVRELVGTGARWGLSVEVAAEHRELSPVFARVKYPAPKSEWLPEPNGAVLLDHFPCQPQNPLFRSYAGWFFGVLAWLSRAANNNRIGVKEVQPGVWVAMRARIADTARLQAPCWVGEGARIGPRAVIGPMAIVENHALVGADAEIQRTLVGPDTMVGKFAELKGSVAWGDTMIDWETGSVAKVTDPLLMCSLCPPTLRVQATDWLGQLADLFTRGSEDLEVLWKQRRMKLP